MIRWRFLEPNPARDLLEQVLQAAGQPHHPRGRGEMMPINVHQTETDVVIEAALPGVKPEDIEVSAAEGLLTIRAHSTVEERDYFHQEMSSIEYSRQVMLPVECRSDKATASFDHGILAIRIPKQKPKAPERINIQVNRSGGRATIEATKGETYSEIKPTPKVAAPKPSPKTAPKPGSSKKPSGGGAGARRPASGSGSGPAR
ncbi:MAG: Hsp20/alpha crystallin family protein [Chloroflexi bacterium]|nr:MAG: Hsp20/alpha crystallin family protein [Chloroflexota bacterium]TME14934.1 MAG: Hsp20/alpha crystallin family protein [Chloroflexota bacterium]TME17884.1 MAG: Hsp20/alpha crystallin family protein [Chloroflexota bacterium]